MKSSTLRFGLVAGLALAASGCASSHGVQTGLNSSPFGSHSAPPVTMDVARLYERQGSMDLAAAGYRELIQKNPTQAAPVHRLAVLLVRQGNLEEADRLFTQAMSLGAPDGELLADVGFLYYLQNRLPEAETQLRRALDQSPGNQRTLNNLGLVLARQGRDQDSLAVFSQAKGAAEAHTSLGFAMAQSGRIDKAEYHLGRALDINPDYRQAADGLVNLASLRDQMPVATQDHAMASGSFNSGKTPGEPMTNRPALGVESRSPDGYVQELSGRLAAKTPGPSAPAAAVDPFNFELPERVRLATPVSETPRGAQAGLYEIASGRRFETPGNVTTKSDYEPSATPRTLSGIDRVQPAAAAFAGEKARFASRSTGSSMDAAHPERVTVASYAVVAQDSTGPIPTGATTPRRRPASDDASKASPVQTSEPANLDKRQKTINRLVTVLQYGDLKDQRNALREILLEQPECVELRESLAAVAEEGPEEIRGAARLVLAEWSGK